MNEIVHNDLPGLWESALVQCEFCSREWVAVRPVGTIALECPRCHRMTNGSGMMPYTRTADEPALA